MAICEKCGNKYFQKECPECKKREWKRKLNKNNPSNKTYIQIKPKAQKKQVSNIKIQSNKILLTIIAISVIIIATIMTIKEYKRYQAEKQIAQFFYGTDDPDEIEKINKKIIEKNKGMLIKMNKANKEMTEEMQNVLIQANKQMREALEKANKEFEKRNHKNY